MYIPEEILEYMKRQERLDEAFGIPGLRVPGRNGKFYRSLVKSSCVKALEGVTEFYHDEPRGKLFCGNCAEGMRRKEILGLEICDDGWHLLRPSWIKYDKCEKCFTRLLIQRFSYDCDDCKRTWVNYRDLAEKQISIQVYNLNH